MDRQKLRNQVFEQTGIKVDCDDPIFALVALNEAVLAAAVERQVGLLHAAAQDLAAQARGAAAAPFAPAPPAVAHAIPTRGAPLFEPREWRLLGAAAAASALGALLVLGGQALLAKPLPAPAAKASALTPEQRDALARGDKLARAVQKLDAQTRGLIQAELDRP
ncbi:hypothetical protein [Janthinobacterium fluminis]|uniref:Anti-sigma factor n=1 Tax=Janthinobacterium fluminis TaxID=2987524 RepID=A0ABT5K3T1_9BURK|nr:hypothetical protein [Janthinobacterium fluminis]MDC8759646.1 hypothetical protein [Janthinobacterium fluminis]